MLKWSFWSKEWEVWFATDTKPHIHDNGEEGSVGCWTALEFGSPYFHDTCWGSYYNCNSPANQIVRAEYFAGTGSRTHPAHLFQGLPYLVSFASKNLAFRSLMVLRFFCPVHGFQAIRAPTSALPILPHLHSFFATHSPTHNYILYIDPWLSQYLWLCFIYRSDRIQQILLQFRHRSRELFANGLPSQCPFLVGYRPDFNHPWGFPTQFSSAVGRQTLQEGPGSDGITLCQVRDRDKAETLHQWTRCWGGGAPEPTRDANLECTSCLSAGRLCGGKQMLCDETRDYCNLRTRQTLHYYYSTTMLGDVRCCYFLSSWFMIHDPWSMLSLMNLSLVFFSGKPLIVQNRSNPIGTIYEQFPHI